MSGTSNTTTTTSTTEQSDTNSAPTPTAAAAAAAASGTVDDSSATQTVDARYAGDPEPSFPIRDLTWERYKRLVENNVEEDDEDKLDDTFIPTRLRPLIDVVSPRIPAKTYHEEVVSCALMSSRVIADFVTYRHCKDYQRTLPPFLAEIQSKRSKQRRILLFTLDPKVGHYGVMCSQTKKVYGAMEIRYHESHPMSAVDSAVNHTDYLYEGYVYDTKARPFTLNYKIKLERALPWGRFEALHENLESTFYFTFKCRGHYQGGIQFPLASLD